MKTNNIKEAQENREKDGIYALSVLNKTKDKKEVRYYIDHNLKIEKEDVGDLIKTTYTVFDAPGIYAVEGIFQRRKEALEKGYVTIQDFIAGQEILLINKYELDTLLNAKPKLLHPHIEYMKVLQLAESPSITNEIMKKTYDMVEYIYNKLYKNQKTLEYIPISKPISFDAYISEQWRKTAATLTPNIDLHKWMKENVPEYLGFPNNRNPKVLVKQLTKRSIIIDFPELIK